MNLKNLLTALIYPRASGEKRPTVERSRQMHGEIYKIAWPATVESIFVGLVGLMLFINWKLFIVTALLLIVTIQLFKRLGGRSRKFYQQQQAALGDVNGNIQEMIEGLKVVKAFTHEEKAKEEFKKLNETYRDAAQKANYYSTMIMPVSGNLMNISYALTAAFGGLLSVLQGFDLGGLVVYLNYSKQVGQPLNQISQQMTTLLSALAGGRGHRYSGGGGEGRQRHALPQYQRPPHPHLGLEDPPQRRYGSGPRPGRGGCPH